LIGGSVVGDSLPVSPLLAECIFFQPAVDCEQLLPNVLLSEFDLGFEESCKANFRKTSIDNFHAVYSTLD